MERYKLSDHIHYDRNDPGKNQSIYFDITPEFDDRLNAVIEKVEEGLNRDKVDDITIALSRTSLAIDAAFGKLTLAELLYVAHTVSAMLTANAAEHYGYQAGYKAAVDKLSRKIPLGPGAFHKNSGQA